MEIDLNQILSALRAEHDRLSDAIVIFERLATGSGPRRGRPPGWIAALRESGDPPKRRGRRRGNTRERTK